jgi:hypothetical protein
MKGGSDFHMRLSSEVSSRLALIASERGVSKNLVVQAALEEFLQIGAGEREKAMTLEDLRKDLYEVKRRLVALREDVEIVGELLSFFIYHWIGYTPRLERDERLSLAVEAKERHDRFLSLFAKKLSTGELSLAAVFGAGERIKPVEAKTPQEDTSSDDLKSKEGASG